MAHPRGKTKSASTNVRVSVDASPREPRILRIAARLGRMIPDDELRRLPKDLSSQIDHYVYGTPKR
ncbi:MAG TPA: hypothetical protein VIY49_33805 [Bryobacteraceae bacterium]